MYIYIYIYIYIYLHFYNKAVVVGLDFDLERRIKAYILTASRSRPLVCLLICEANIFQLCCFNSKRLLKAFFGIANNSNKSNNV